MWIEDYFLFDLFSLQQNFCCHWPKNSARASQKWIIPHMWSGLDWTGNRATYSRVILFKKSTLLSLSFGDSSLIFTAGSRDKESVDSDLE